MVRFLLVFMESVGCGYVMNWINLLLFVFVFLGKPIKKEVLMSRLRDGVPLYFQSRHQLASTCF